MAKKNNFDGYYNAVLGHGLKRFDPFMHYHFKKNGFMGFQECDELYTYNGIAAKIIEAPANEAVRTGFTLKDGNKVLEQNDDVMSVLEDLDAEKALATALTWDRLYGGCLVLLLADDGGDLMEPLNENHLRSIERLMVYDPQDVVINPDWYSDPYDKKFGMPQTYTVTNYYGGSFVVHESRCLRFTGATISQRVRNLRDGWGGKVFDRIAGDMMRYDGGLSLSFMALSRLSQGILKLSGLAAVLSREGGDEIVQKRLQLIDMARHLMNTIAIDEDDEYDQKNLTLSGVKEIQESFQQALSAVTDIPATVLFGRSPAGQNATGKADFENYYNMIERIQKHSLKPQLARLVELVGKCSDYGLHLPEAYTIEFNPLWNASDKEQAETENTKAQAISNIANAMTTLINVGALDALEARATLKENGTFVMDDSSDFLTESTEAKPKGAEGGDDEA